MAAKELLDLIGELEVVLSGDSQATELKLVLQNLQEAKDTKFKHIESAKSELMALKRCLEEAEVQFQESQEQLSAAEKRLEEISASKENHVAAIKEIEKETESLRSSLKVMEEKCDSISHQIKKVGNDLEMDIPKLKNLFQLFTTISKIRWDYECKESDIRGYICGGKAVRPILMSQSENKSKYYMVNYLWDLIDTIHDH